jgi:MFS family permease
MRRGRGWRDLTGGKSLTPLLVLFGLNLVDEFDRVAFAALTPEIRDAFDLADDEIVAIGSLAAVFILIGALPIGYIGDRFPRVRIARWAAVVWGTAAVVTGLAWAVPVLFLARLCSGMARTSNEVVHPSLLVDYYEPAVLPRVFQVHRMATPLGASAAIVAGALGAAFGWRWAFVVLAVPTFVLLAWLTRLQEPRRGATMVPHVTVHEDPPPIPFREARRILFGIRTLRRSWTAGFMLGIAFIALAQLLSLFFENVHGYGPFGRGVVQFSYGAGIIVGIFIGAQVAMRSTQAGQFARLSTIIGASFVQFAIVLVLLAASPWAALATLLVCPLGVAFGIYQPAYFPLVARIVPPAIRTQTYGWTLLIVGLGALLSIPLANYGEHHSYRIAFCILAAIVASGGVVARSARRFVDDDVRHADETAASA